MADISAELNGLQSEMKSFIAKANEEKTQHGTMLAETKSALEKVQAQLDAMDVKMASRHTGAEQKSFSKSLEENDNVARLLKDRRGSAVISVKASDLERKTTITSTAVGAAVSGVLGIDRIPGIVAEARQELRLRDMLTARPTTFQLIDYIKVNSPLAAAGMVAETNLKPENAVTFTSESEKIRTIATFLPASKQVMSDFHELAGYLQDALPYAVNLEEELQMLAGDGSGENLHGFLAQAAAYNTASNATGDTKIDTIGHAMAQIAAAKELAPTFVVLNTADLWKIRLTKDAYGRYILGDPNQANLTPSLFGVPIVGTTNIAANTFLVGSGAAPAAEIRDREEMTVEISTEHADFFQRNMIAIRAEKRTALIVKRPNAYVTGTFPVAGS